MRKVQLLLPFIVLVVGLAGCGGGGEDDNAGTAEVTEAIERFATNADPAACKTLATQDFLEQTEFNLGHEAVERCEEDTEETVDDPSSMDFSQVEIDGSSATADVSFEGGNFDGQTLSIELVEEGGRWKLDAVTGFVEFDKDKLVKSFEEDLIKGTSGLEPVLAACIGDAIDSLSDEEAEDLMLSGSQKRFFDLTGSCTSGAGQ